MIDCCATAGENCGLTQFLAGIRSSFVQRVHILRSAVWHFGFGGSFLPSAGAYLGGRAQLLCGAQQLSGCKFWMRTTADQIADWRHNHLKY
jgi:hypothetical protein